jgi:hypothetical protein
MQCARHLPRTLPFPTPWPPVSLQCTPNRCPTSSSRFHHHFLDLLLDHPFRQQGQLLGVGTVPASLKLVFVVDFDVRHNYRQHLFMDVNSGYPIRHRLPPGGGGERAGDYVKQDLGLSPLPQGE